MFFSYETKSWLSYIKVTAGNKPSAETSGLVKQMRLPRDTTAADG